MVWRCLALTWRVQDRIRSQNTSGLNIWGERLMADLAIQRAFFRGIRGRGRRQEECSARHLNPDSRFGTRSPVGSRDFGETRLDMARPPECNGVFRFVFVSSLLFVRAPLVRIKPTAQSSGTQGSIVLWRSVSPLILFHELHDHESIQIPH